MASIRKYVFCILKWNYFLICSHFNLFNIALHILSQVNLQYVPHYIFGKEDHKIKKKYVALNCESWLLFAWVVWCKNYVFRHLQHMFLAPKTFRTSAPCRQPAAVQTHPFRFGFGPSSVCDFKAHVQQFIGISRGNHKTLLLETPWLKLWLEKLKRILGSKV